MDRRSDYFALFQEDTPVSNVPELRKEILFSRMGIVQAAARDLGWEQLLSFAELTLLLLQQRDPEGRYILNQNSLDMAMQYLNERLTQTRAAQELLAHAA